MSPSHEFDVPSGDTRTKMCPQRDTVAETADAPEIAASSDASSAAAPLSSVVAATPRCDRGEDHGGDGGQPPPAVDFLTPEQIRLFRSLTEDQRRALFASLPSADGDGEQRPEKTIPAVQSRRSPDDDDADSRRGESIDEVKRFELFRGTIEHEDELLNQRVSWIILAQSFLMAAFITSEGSDSLRYVTATTGLLTVVATFPAIYAAGRNIEIQQRVYFRMMESDERCRFLHGHARDEVNRDPDEMRRRMKRGHMLPGMAFRGDYGIPILHTVLGLVVVQILGWAFLLIALTLEW